MNKEITELKQEVKILKDQRTKEYYNKSIRAMQDVNAALSLERRIGPKNELIKLRKDRVHTSHYVDKNEDAHEKACSYAALNKQLLNLNEDAKNKLEFRYGPNILQFYKSQISAEIVIDDYSENDIEPFNNYFD